jgi:hypothetical protein
MQGNGVRPMSGEPKELKISVDTGNIQAVLKRMTEIEHENKLLLEEKTQREKEFEKQLSEKETERQQAEERANKLGGSGNLPASLNGNFGNEGGSAIPSGAHEFDSFEEMIEWARLNDKKAYEALKSKSANAIANNKNYWEWTDHFDEEGNSLIGRTLHKQNAQKRMRK